MNHEFSSFCNTLIETTGFFEGTILLVGKTDSGKTTLMQCLLDAFKRRGRTVSLVDADLGQSRIGPPTTMGYLPPGMHTHTAILFDPPALHFLGDTTPAGKIEPAAWYTAHLIQLGKKYGRVVLVDTCGYFGCAEAERMKILQAEWGKVDLIIALGEQRELCFLQEKAASSVLMIPPCSGVPVKTPQQRKAHREALFQTYFSRVRFQRIDLHRFSSRPPDLSPWIEGNVSSQSFLAMLSGEKKQYAYNGLLCGLWDTRGVCIGLGRLRRLEILEGWAQLAIPKVLKDDVHTVVPGILRVGPTGEEMGRID